MNPMHLEEMAWTFASFVRSRGAALDAVADEDLKRLVPRARDRRAVIAFALLKEWVSVYFHLESVGHDCYEQGPRYEREKRDRYERLHGIGTYPREDWDG